MPTLAPFVHLGLLTFAVFFRGCQALPNPIDTVSPDTREVSPLESVVSASGTDGVFHLPLTRVSNKKRTSKGLVRRDAESIDLNWDAFAVNLHLNDHGPYLYQVALNDDLLMSYNKKDTGGYSPKEDDHAHPNGPVVYNLYNKTAHQYQAEKVSFGPVTLSDFGFLYMAPVVASDPGGPVGTLGLGLPGSNAFKRTGDFAAASVLETIYKAKSWAKPIFSLLLRYGTEGGNAKLVLGSANSSTFWQDSSSHTRFQLPVTINGHKGETDLSTFEYNIIVPPAVARKMIKEAGMKPVKNEDGRTEGRMPCKDISQVSDLHIETEVASIAFKSEQIFIRDENDPETCIYLVKGAKQEDYPTPFSLGLIFMTLVDVAFDFTPDHPRIGFNPL